jgi:predicted kinase
MRTIIVYKGLPGSGKSTLAAALITKEPGRFVRINRDSLRSMVVGPGNNPHARDSDREDLVRTFKDELVRQAIRSGYDVILDDTHLVPMTVKKIHQLAASVGDVMVVEKGVNVPVDECIVRDAKRSGFEHVGEKVIRDMARGAGLDKNGKKLSDKEAYYPPRWASGQPGADPVTCDQDKLLPKAIIVDLDGTWSLLNGRSPYNAETCDQDPPNYPVIECVKAMYLQGYAVLFTSGREDKFREPTERHIAMHGMVPIKDDQRGLNDPFEEVIQHQLFMRATGDMRKDSVVKSELYEQNIKGKYNVVLVLDDRNQVVDFWRSIGLTCMQVAPGNF